MTEPALFQQQREIWQAFRQAVAQRKLTERNAAQRWQTEQHAADRILEQILNQAKKRCDQEESRATKEYQKLLQDASNTREQIQRQAKQTLQQAEADIQKHHQSEHKQANLVLEQAKNQAQERLRQEESEAISVASAEVKVIKEAWDSARKLAEAKQDQAERVWRQCRGRLEGARLDLRQLIPTEIPPATPDEVLGEADPPQRLEQSLEAVLRAGRAVHDAVDDLLRWRETWQRRRNWGIGGAIATTFVVLIGMSIWNAQIEETNRRATATAFYPTYVAMTTSTAEAEATATAEAQAKATATARAQATATAQAMATATAQAKATATARAMATATAQARATATVQAILAARPSSKKVIVYADKEWQDTGMFVLAGETVSIRYVAGSWNHCAPNGCPDSKGDGVPDGPQNWPDNVLQGCTHFKLIARISNYTLCTGVNYNVVAQISGFLQLRANDTQIGDNAGRIIVQIKVK